MPPTGIAGSLAYMLRLASLHRLRLVEAETKDFKLCRIIHLRADTKRSQSPYSPQIVERRSVDLPACRTGHEIFKVGERSAVDDRTSSSRPDLEDLIDTGPNSILDLVE